MFPKSVSTNFALSIVKVSGVARAGIVLLVIGSVVEDVETSPAVLLVNHR